MTPIAYPTICLALILFMIGRLSLLRYRSGKTQLVLTICYAILGAPGVLMVLYYLHWFDHAVWFYEFRSMPYSELTAAGTGLFAGALSALIKDSVLFTKPILISMLCLGIAAPHLKPILYPLPADQFTDQWKEGVCLQSTPSSCGAASAATIFRFYGLDIQESELAQECLTYHGGTENWYIARAFRKRGINVHYRTESGFPSDLKLPVIAGVRVGSYGHFIAITEMTDQGYITGDPLKGRQLIPLDRITDEFHFTGFFMEISAGKRATSINDAAID